MTARAEVIGVIVATLLLMSTSLVFAGMEPGEFKLSGKGYFYYFHSLNDGADGKENKFDFSRMYFGAKFQVSKQFMVRYLTDMSHQSGSGKFEILAKYAYVDWDLGYHGAHLLLGLQSTYNWKSPEAAWGYRVIRYAPMESFGDYWGSLRSSYEDRLEMWVETLDGDKSSADSPTVSEVENQASNFHSAASARMGSSADMGIGVKLKPSNDCYVWFVVRNGGGYKMAETDMYKNFQMRAAGYFLEKTLHFSAFAELEPFKGVDKEGDPKRRMNFQWDVMLSYEQKGIFLIACNVNSKVFPGPLDDVTALCISGFGNAYIVEKKRKILARVDVYRAGFNDVQLQPGTSWESDAKVFIVGFEFIPDKHVHIVPNVQILSFKDDALDSIKDFFVHVEFKF